MSTEDTHTLTTRLAAVEAERLPDEIAVTIKALQDATRGLALGYGNPGHVKGLRAALDATIIRHLSAALARAVRAEKALKTAQSALAMLTEPNEIRSTSVANAWAIAVDAELQCRRALSSPVAEEA